MSYFYANVLCHCDLETRSRSLKTDLRRYQSICKHRHHRPYSLALCMITASKEIYLKKSEGKNLDRKKVCNVKAAPMSSRWMWPDSSTLFEQRLTFLRASQVDNNMYTQFCNTHTHTHTHARTHARTHAHARTHTRTHTRTHARTHISPPTNSALKILCN